jgi:starch synthase
MTIDEFAKTICNIYQILKNRRISFNDYISDNIKIGDEKLLDEFYRYCIILANSKHLVNLPTEEFYKVKVAERFLSYNMLGPICFITPEIGEPGKWNGVGGLGKMADELTQALAWLGQEIIIISPYYNMNKEGKYNYLSDDPLNIKYVKNTKIRLDQIYEFGVHHGTGNDGIKYYFLHNEYIFPKPYPNFDPKMAIRSIACFAKASLQLLCDINTVPSIIVTNDWFSGLTAAYVKNGSFGEYFDYTRFLHVCHNLEISYEGRIYPSEEEGNLDYIYQFEPKWLIDFTWKEIIINPSRCAINLSDQWATVSHSYKNDLLNVSPLRVFLRVKKCPFSHPNGICKEERLKLLNECGLSREECKKYIQQKYFLYKDIDTTVPIFSFIGRITEQKGVMLILDSVEEMIKATNGKINILLGGTGDISDSYVNQCIKRIGYLKEKYPYSFWAEPNSYFKDGIKINKGSDFGLMPSLFEPGGIVQHEFFIAGTPVIAFRTG